jgi:hypothetical protein
MGYSFIPAVVDPTDFDQVLRHVGKRCAPLHRWRQLLRAVSPRGWGAVRAYAGDVMRLVADPRVLFTAAKVLASGGPKAAGPNGLRLEALADDELWRMCAVVGRAIDRGTYRPGEQRTTWVPKASGMGNRPIVVSDVQDRVVEKAAALILRPALDVLFDPLSFAYRPWRTREQAIAVVEILTTTGHPVWLGHDLKDAYRHVPVSRLLEVVHKLLPCPRLRDFLGQVLPAQSKRVGGIKQGGPLSPLMLEVYLAHFLDRPLRKAGHPVRMVRYADDVLICAADVPSAERADEAVRRLLHPTGLRVKASFANAVTDLRTGAGDWLGFRFRLQDGEFRVGLADIAFLKLERQLVRAHGCPRPAARALQILEGWVGQLGPCRGWEDAGAVCRRVRTTAAGCGFRETPSVGRLEQLWAASAGRWEQTRRAVGRNDHYLIRGPVTAPTPTSVVW